MSLSGSSPSRRGVSPEAEGALAQPVVVLLHLVRCTLPDGELRFCNASVPVEWAGEWFSGSGELVGFEALGEALGVDSPAQRIRLSGVDVALVREMLRTDIVNSPVVFYTAILQRDGETLTLIQSPMEEWRGRIDATTFSLGESTASITVTVESRTANADQAPVSRYTHEEQQLLSPGDNIFAGMNGMASKEIVWPSKDWRPS